MYTYGYAFVQISGVEEVTNDQSVPIITRAAWWALRDKFASSLPTSVTSSYLAVALNLKENAAKQVLTNLKKLLLVDEQDRPTELANRWRDDGDYSAVCAEIVENAYPAELRQLVPGPDPDQDAANRWFRQSYRLGDGAAANAARTYVLIASADVSQRDKNPGGKAAANTKADTPKPARARRPRNEGGPPRGAIDMPSPQIAVQVNISPEMTAEQIESVFASMARHFYGSVTTDQ